MSKIEGFTRPLVGGFGHEAENENVVKILQFALFLESKPTITEVLIATFVACQSSNFSLPFVFSLSSVLFEGTTCSRVRQRFEEYQSQTNTPKLSSSKSFQL